MLKKTFIGASAFSLALFATVQNAFAEELDYVTEVGTALTDMVDDIGSVIFTNLPIVFGVIAALMGLTFLVRYIRRWIGGARG